MTSWSPRSTSRSRIGTSPSRPRRWSPVDRRRSWPRRAGRPRRAGLKRRWLRRHERPRRRRRGAGRQRPQKSIEPARPELFLLSARSEAALRRLVAAHARQLAAASASLADLCFTLQAGRLHQRHRLAIVAGSVAELRSKLALLEHWPERFARGELAIFAGPAAGDPRTSEPESPAAADFTALADARRAVGRHASGRADSARPAVYPGRHDRLAGAARRRRAAAPRPLALVSVRASPLLARRADGGYVSG